MSERLGASVIPFAVSREDAAALVGISPTKFDELVAGGQMPQPREIGRRVLWDSDELRDAWRRMPRRATVKAANPWDTYR